MSQSRSYDVYLRTEHWLSFARQIRSDRAVCEGCGMDSATAYKEYRQDLNVHHKTYERLGAELPDDVLLLCHRCHAVIHNTVFMVDFAAQFSMPEVRPVGYIRCESCDCNSDMLIWNFGEVNDIWLCSDCERGADCY